MSAQQNTTLQSEDITTASTTDTGVATQQWFDVFAPPTGAESVLRLGASDTQTFPSGGGPPTTTANPTPAGIALATNGAYTAVSTGTSQHLALGDLDTFSAATVNVGGVSGVVIASVASSAKVPGVNVDGSLSVPVTTVGNVLGTHDQWVADRNAVYNSLNTAVEWMNVAFAVMALAKTILGSNWDGSALVRLTTVANDVGAILSATTATVTASANSGQGEGTLTTTPTSSS